jgi:peptide/nickel transport system ATP-binding protein
LEDGPHASLFAPPFEPYIEALRSAVPVPDLTAEQRRVGFSGEKPSPINVPNGCCLASRCPRKLAALCDDVAPPERKGEGGQMILSYIPLDELAAVAPAFPHKPGVRAPA